MVNFPSWYIILHKASGRPMPFLGMGAAGYTQLDPTFDCPAYDEPRRLATELRARRVLQAFCLGPRKRWHPVENKFYDELGALPVNGLYNRWEDTDPHYQRAFALFAKMPPIQVKHRCLYITKPDSRQARPIGDYEIRKATLHW